MFVLAFVGNKNLTLLQALSSSKLVSLGECCNLHDSFKSDIYQDIDKIPERQGTNDKVSVLQSTLTCTCMKIAVKKCSSSSYLCCIKHRNFCFTGED